MICSIFQTVRLIYVQLLLTQMVCYGFPSFFQKESIEAVTCFSTKVAYNLYSHRYSERGAVRWTWTFVLLPNLLASARLHLFLSFLSISQPLSLSLSLSPYLTIGVYVFPSRPQAITPLPSLSPVSTCSVRLATKLVQQRSLTLKS